MSQQTVGQVHSRPSLPRLLTAFALSIGIISLAGSGNQARAEGPPRCGSLVDTINPSWHAFVQDCGNGGFKFNFNAVVPGSGSVSIAGHGGGTQCIASYTYIPLHGNCMPATTSERKTTYCHHIASYQPVYYANGSCNNKFLGIFGPNCNPPTKAKVQPASVPNYVTAPCPAS